MPCTCPLSAELGIGLKVYSATFFFVWLARKVTNVCPYKPYFVSGLYVFRKAALLFLSLLAFSLTFFFIIFFLTLQFQSKTSNVQHVNKLIDF